MLKPGGKVYRDQNREEEEGKKNEGRGGEEGRGNILVEKG